MMTQPGTLEWLQQRIKQARARVRRMPPSEDRRVVYRQIADMERYEKRLTAGVVGVKEYNPFDDTPGNRG